MIRSILLSALLVATLFGDIGTRPCAAQPLPLSVEELFRLIDANSRTLDLKALCVEDARSGELVARSRRLPVLDASLSVGYLGNGYLTDRDFSGGMAIRNPHSNNNFALDAMQVVYSGGAIAGGIRMAELQTRMAELDLEQSRQEVRFVLLGGLIDLHCLGDRRRLLDEHCALAEQVLEHMRARYDEGVVLRSDITRYELQVEDLRLQRARVAEQLSTTAYRLANALGLSPLPTEIEPRLPQPDAVPRIEEEPRWQELAQRSSFALQRAELGITAGELRRRIIAADKRPRIDLFAYGRFDSPIVTEVPVLDKNFLYWGFGVRLSFRLSSLYTANKRVRQATLAVDESRKAYELGAERLRNDVQAAFEGYRTAATELRTREKSLELARQNYAIVNDRYENGMALVTDMVDAANVRLSAEIGYENARTMLLYAYYRLKYVTNTL